MNSIAQPRTVTAEDLKRVSNDELSPETVQIIEAAGAYAYRLDSPFMPAGAEAFVMEVAGSVLAAVADASLDAEHFERVIGIALAAWFHAEPGQYVDPDTGTKCIAVGRRRTEDAR